MGNVFRVQVGPTIESQNNISLLDKEEVSRSSFKFLKQLDTWGFNQESTLWLAASVNNPSETYYVRQSSKVKIYNNKRVEATFDQLHLLTEHNNPNIIKVYHAFQDYSFLYLVMEKIDLIPFQDLLASGYIFSEDQARYIIIVLLSIFDYIHGKGFCATDLSPRNFHFDRQTGQLKLIQIRNPARINNYLTSNSLSTPSRYSAPEVLYRGKIGIQCDYYSLGIILYEILTEQRKSYCCIRSQNRSSILKEQIEVDKSKIPEEWQPQSADFLIKLLVKNPALRLGRYGSFEVRNHSWLKQFDVQDCLKNQVNLRMYQQQPIFLYALENKKDLEEKIAEELKENYFFQSMFQDYSYRYLKGEESSQVVKSTLQFQKSSILENDSHLKLQQTLF